MSTCHVVAVPIARSPGWYPQGCKQCLYPLHSRTPAWVGTDFTLPFTNTLPRHYRKLTCPRWRPARSSSPRNQFREHRPCLCFTVFFVLRAPENWGVPPKLVHEFYGSGLYRLDFPAVIGKDNTATSKTDAAGFSSPKVQADAPPLRSELAAFLCPAHGIALFGRWCAGGLAPAGFLYSGFPARTLTALFAFCAQGHRQGDR